MNEKVGIAVGHFGVGTGCSFQTADEWTLSLANAWSIVRRLKEENKLTPILLYIDREEHPWDLVQRVSKASLPTFLGGLGNVDVRYEWAIRDELEALVELHYNSAVFGTPEGHEVWLRRRSGPKTRRLAETMLSAFDAHLGNRGRGLQQKSFRTLFRLHAANVPAVILEPAFIREERILLGEWQLQYRDAVITALYSFFNV